jgi:hypothetical protein
MRELKRKVAHESIERARLLKNLESHGPTYISVPVTEPKGAKTAVCLRATLKELSRSDMFANAPHRRSLPALIIPPAWKAPPASIAAIVHSPLC